MLHWAGRTTLASVESGRFEIAAHAASLGVWDWELASNRFYYSQRAKQICGFDPEAEVTFEQIRAVTHPDDLPRTSALAAAALDPDRKNNQPYRYRIVRADDGQVRWVLAHGEAVFERVGDKETAIRYIGTLQDITAQHEHEQALLESESRLRLAIEAGRMAVWELDLDRNVITHSAELNALYGFPADATPSLDDFRARYAPGEEERVNREGDEIRARGETEIQTTFRARLSDNTEKWLLLRARLAPATEAIPRRVLGIMIDITAQKAAEERAALIAREMQHRIKNTLTVVQVLAEQSFRRKDKTDVAGQTFSGRLQALAAASQAITAGDWSATDIRSLIEDVTRPYRSRDSDPFAIAGPSVNIPASAATGLALALHELCTNALKYGALSVPDGRVAIRWTLTGHQLELLWEESGGPSVSESPARGFGTKLLQRGLASHGTVEHQFRPEGVVCVISLPQMA